MSLSLMSVRIIYIIMLCCWGLTVYAWNAQGHRVVAQIAYDNLTPQAKEMCRNLLSSRSKKSFNARFLAAATWLDRLRFKNIHWYDTFHYIDIPFTDDNSVLPPVETTNALWSIKNAISVLSSIKTGIADKRLALLILIHVVGDIHQPLHAVSRVSHQLPKGDMGGNLFPLGSNLVGTNLHQYWDYGAGLFIGYSKIKQIRHKAQLLEQKWPCNRKDLVEDPHQWAKTSYELAITQAYRLKPREIPGKQYQLTAQSIVQKQVAASGCRLAVLLNNIAKEYPKKIVARKKQSGLRDRSPLT